MFDYRREEEFKRIDLLVNVARLYYEHGYNQQMISQKLGLSRPYISKLLTQARAEGIVTIQINDRTQTETALERELRQRFSLRRVIVLPRSLDQTPLSKVGVACGRYINSIISNGDVVGVSWGHTMFACAQNAIKRDDITDISVVQVCGGISCIERNIYASEIPRLWATALSGTPYIMPLPAILDSIAIKDAVINDHSIKGVLDVAQRANIILFTLGSGFGANNALVQAGYLEETELEQLNKAGAVGDICSHIIDEDGKLLSPELDARTISLPLDVLKQKDYRIAVAIGESKVRSICGALNGGYPNVLITDEDTAIAVLRRLDERGKQL
ncbi:MAG: sugar-binding transcriptional regulator [Defluviitaleaceae bacterium]|nr:sugar-binding transcriptional regulator [Defluviitaleaceae bacterium]